MKRKQITTKQIFAYAAIIVAIGTILGYFFGYQGSRINHPLERGVWYMIGIAGFIFLLFVLASDYHQKYGKK